MENKVSNTSGALGGLYNKQTQKLQESNFKEMIIHSKLESPMNRMLYTMTVVAMCGLLFTTTKPLTLQEVSELRLEITHDARTRKIRPGSDLRHDVQYIHIYIYIYIKFTANSSMWGSLRLAPTTSCCGLSGIHEAVR